MNHEEKRQSLVGTVISTMLTWLSRWYPKTWLSMAAPKELLCPRRSPGLYLGQPLHHRQRDDYYVGRPIKGEGNALYVGPPGCGKTTSGLMGSILKWGGSQVVVAIKGDLVDFCQRVARATNRRCIVISPTKATEDGVRYDPFDPARQNPSNAPAEIQKVANSLLPDLADGKDRIWRAVARSYLAGCLLFYFSRGKDFLAALNTTLQRPIAPMIEDIMENGGPACRAIVASLVDVPPVTLNCIGMELSTLSGFQSIAGIRETLTIDQGESCFSWESFITGKKAQIVVLDFPQADYRACAPLFRLIVDQMIAAAETRPERSYKGYDLPPVLVALDEFTALGRLPSIQMGLATLRSRGITFALYVQSIAALDDVYGHLEGRALRDCTSYYVIYGVQDVESQQYFSNLVGRVTLPHLSTSLAWVLSGDTEDGPPVTASLNIDTAEVPAVASAQLRWLHDPVVITPEGCFLVKKHRFYGADNLSTPDRR